MNAYDFDKTVYHRDSTIEFYLFCLKSHPGIARHLPAQGWAAIKYLLKRIPKKDFKQRFFCFLSSISDVEKEVVRFWESRDLQEWYVKQRSEEDLFISASPDFLLRPIAQRYVVALIATEVDPQTGRFLGENCYGEEKPHRFFAEYGDMQVKEFYSDSLSDAPMAKLAEKAFLVQGQNKIPWPEH